MEDTSAHAQPSSNSMRPLGAPPRRPRVALACQRCKGRKQRCDGVSPSCKSCLKAGVHCIYEPALRPRYPGGKMLYISALEERIAFLEAQLPQYGEDHFGYSEAGKGNFAHTHRRQSNTSTTQHLDDPQDEDDSTLVDGVAYLSLCASGATDTVSEPFYMGSSSGATIARMIQSSIFRAGKRSNNRGPFSSLRSGSVSSAASSLPQPAIPMLEFPQPSQAKQLFSVFFNRLHTRWPILDRKVYEQVFKHQYENGALPIIERSSLHLIYAISARFMQLTKQGTTVDPEAHFSAAIEAMDYIMEQHNSATVQFLTLLAIYGQRSPYGAGVWSQVRYSITLCVELGMHRRPTAHSPVRDPRDLELRRRLFWSCYCIDRVTSMLLGRTFAISDRDINVELPSDDIAFWDLTSSQPPENECQGWSNITPFIHVVKLRRLQSKIQRTVFRVDIDHSTRSPEDRAREDAKVAKICASLDHWVSSAPETRPHTEGGPNWMYQPEIQDSYQDSKDYFTLQYHKAVLSLYTALLPRLSVSDQRFTSCAQSSANICTTFKRLHQQKVLSFTVVGLHSCFVAGLTLIYCLWRDKSIFSFDVLEATRSCSQCLTIFGEKWNGAVKYGEIFESLSGSVLRAIMEPTQDGSRNLKINLDNLSTLPATTNNQEKDKVTDPLLGAVKDVFMEVDEDVPGGWQGWRIFNEMVQSDIQEPALATGGISESGPVMWNDLAYSQWDEGNETYNLEGEANIQMDNFAFLKQGGWDHGLFAG